MLPQNSVGNNPAAQILQGALELIERGYKVFPCNSDKRPSTAHAIYDATDDPDVVRQWAREGRLDHVAFATGAPSSVVVTDADDEEAREHMIAHYGEPHVRTRRGAHWYWKPAGGKITSTGIGANGRKLIPGNADSKGDGGYVIAPRAPVRRGRTASPIVTPSAGCPPSLSHRCAVVRAVGRSSRKKCLTGLSTLSQRTTRPSPSATTPV